MSSFIKIIHNVFVGSNLKQILVYLLSLQMVLQPLFANLAQAHDLTERVLPGISSDLTPEEIKLQNDFNHALTYFLGRNFSKAPEASPDLYLVTLQNLRVTKLSDLKPGTPHKARALLGTSFNFLTSTLPRHFKPSLKYVVKYEYSPATKEFTLSYQTSTHLIEHVIPNLDVKAITQDGELVVLLTADGRVLAIDQGLIKRLGFDISIPIVEVANLKQPISDSVKISFLTNGTKPFNVTDQTLVPLDQDQKHVLTNGNLSVVDQRSSNALAIYDRRVMYHMISSSIGALDSLTAILDSDPDVIEKQLEKPIDDKDLKETLHASLDKMDPLTRTMYVRLYKVAGKSLAIEAERNKSLAAKGLSYPVHRYTLESHRDEYDKLVMRARSESRVNPIAREAIRTRSFESYYDSTLRELREAKKEKELTLQQVVKKKVLFYGKATLGIAAVAAPLYAASQGYGPEWGIASYNWLYKSMFPDVIKDSAYRITLLASSAYLLAFIPLYYAVGYAAKLARPSSDLTVAQRLGNMGKYIYAELSLWPWHRVAQITRQPLFLEYIQQRISPIRVVKTDAVYKYKIEFPGFVRYYKKRSDETHAQRIQEKRALLAQELKTQSFKRKVALAVAASIISEKYSLDPATLIGLARLKDSGEGSNVTEAKIRQSQKEWMALAREVQSTIAQTAFFTDLHKMSITEIMQHPDYSTYYESLKQVADQLTSQSVFKKTTQMMRKVWWDSASSLASLGLKEYEFIKDNDITHRAAHQVSSQFDIDYRLGVIQMGLVGDRANFEKPNALAAMRGAPLSTNPAHLYDMLDQVIRAYGVVAPASKMLVFQNEAASVAEDRYEIPSSVAFNPQLETESVLQGLGAQAKFVANPRNLKFGARNMRDITRRLKTLPVLVTFAFVGRVMVAHQTPEMALAAFIFMLSMSPWRYGWPWPIIDTGNIKYGEQMDGLKKEWSDSLAEFEQAVRLKEYEKAYEHFNNLNALYARRSYADRISGVSDKMLELQSKMLDPENKESAEVLQAEMEKAAENYLVRLKETPPGALKINPTVGEITNWIGALSTTYLATSLAVDSFTITWKDAGIGVIESAAFYALFFYGQKPMEQVYDYVTPRLNGAIDFIKSKFSSMQVLGPVPSENSGQVCGNALKK